MTKTQTRGPAHSASQSTPTPTVASRTGSTPRASHREKNERTAIGRIDPAVRRALATDTPIDTGTARLIAAATHSGSESALGRFAATGALDPRAALREIEQAEEGPPGHEMPGHWVLCLCAYLLLQLNGESGGHRGAA